MKYKIPIDLFDTQDGGCHLFVKAVFSGRDKGLLIIDTGANRTVFDKSLIEVHADFKEEIKDEISAGINASIENSQEAILHDLQIGKFNIQNLETVVISLEYLNTMYGKIAKRQIWGLIGGDFLKQYNCIINYKNKELVIQLD